MAKNKLFLGFLFTVFSILFLIAPLVAWMYFKKDVYFIEANGTDMTMGAIVTAIFIGLMLAGSLKDIDKRFGKLIVLCFVLAMTWFFETFLADMFYIVLSAIIGYILYLLFSTIGRRYIAYYRSYRDEKARVEARREAEEEVGNV